MADHDGSVGSTDRGGTDPAAGPALHHGTVESDRRHEPRPTPGRAAAVDALQALEVEAILLQMARNISRVKPWTPMRSRMRLGTALSMPSWLTAVTNC